MERLEVEVEFQPFAHTHEATFFAENVAYTVFGSLSCINVKHFWKNFLNFSPENELVLVHRPAL